VDKASIFIDHGADLHARDEEWRSTPLAWAARAGQLRMAEFLLRRGARPSLADDPEWATPRAWAHKRGHEAIVRLLDDYERSDALPPRRLDRYDGLARDLVDAFAGDEEAIRRVITYFRAERPMTWDRPSTAVLLARLRKAVIHRLGAQRSAQTTETSLAPQDTQWLIAREEGFGSWEELVRSVDG
jgi:hypothetical protein